MILQKKIFLVSFAFILAHRFLQEFFEKSVSSEGEKALLVIGVLSAQNNSAARNSIRLTWKTLTKKPNIQFYFLVGRYSCPIHPMDRKSDVSCDALTLSSTPETAYSKQIWTPSLKNYDLKGPTTTYGISSFTFHVNFPVIVHGVRVWTQALQHSIEAIVSLKNARTGTLISSMSFQASTWTRNENDWIETQSNNPYLLPKSFDAELQILTKSFQNETLSFNSALPCHGFSSWLNLNGGIEFTTEYGPDTGWRIFNQTSCSPISLLLELHDVETFQSLRQTRDLEWQELSASLLQDLEKEASRERDIIFLDVIDVYSNIPRKLLKFYKWLDENVNFSFFLKADDDTFLNLPAIEQSLQSVVTAENVVISMSQLWWWGKLRFGLPVERHGKWQELEYAAPVYPPFPCGAAYVLNKNIIKLLVANSRWLHMFQGEDTSLGIWLSGFHPHMPENTVCHWCCTNNCDASSCNRGQLSTGAMHSVWYQYLKSKNQVEKLKK